MSGQQNDRHVIAIDFGTSNTYITRCPNNINVPTEIQIYGNDSVGIETVLLYSNESGDISPYVGTLAVETIGDASEEDRKKYAYQFRSHFKPDILQSLEARRNAKDFFSALIRDAAKKNLNFFPKDNRVIIGVPSESPASYRSTLEEIAKDAGYGDVETIEEPFGAMLDAISANEFPIADIIDGLLVIDFGGGTCDYAFLKDGEVKHSWGDMHLGGRIFDDLFYRWYCEQNQGKEDELRRNGDDFIVRTHYCRECKEKFSQYVLNVNKPFSYSFRQYGKMEGLTWDEFISRAKNYRPTESFKRFQDESGCPLPERLTNGSTDLLKWFEDSLKSGLDKAHIALSDIHVITLAGGSCQWKFVSDFCKEIWQDKRIFSSPKPYAAIANGLAVLPALRKIYEQKKEQLQNEMPAFIDKEIAEMKTELNKANERIVDQIMTELFDAKIKPVLHQFREKGGTVNQLEKDIAHESSSFENRINTIAKNEITNEIKSLFTLFLNHTRDWLKQHNLRLGNFAAFDPTTGSVKMETVDAGIANNIVAVINTIVTGIIAIIIANICGGGGTAIIMTGPLGLLIGAIIGVAVGALIFLYGRKKATEMAKSYHIPALLLYPILTDAKIASCRDKMKKDLLQQLESSLQITLPQVKSAMEIPVRKEIDRLSVVNVT
ncbi:MAG: rod shape-determining protein [Planctomycetaceae bacterium]|nr:rod shape-determining protein [Planctomycetaceae bacterium]